MTPSVTPNLGTDLVKRIFSELDPVPLDPSFNIDMDVDEYMAFQSRTTPRRPRIPMDQWQLLDDASRRAWHQLSAPVSYTHLTLPTIYSV